MGRVKRIEIECRDCGRTYTKTLSGSLSCSSCYGRKIRARNREYAERIKREGKCAICGIADPVVLQWHHPDPSSKWRHSKDRGTPNGKTGVGGLLGMVVSLDRIKEEIAKCVLVCANDHLRIEAGLIDCAEYGF